jgi:hypothetical protein
LAVIAPILTRLPNILRPLFGWVGFFGIIAALFLINADSRFPAPAAALPVLSSALVILAGTGGEQGGLAPLTNRVSGYLGDISYSLYLWHFPVIILSGTFVDFKNPLAVALTFAAIFIISIYSYHLVEDPIRKSDWLSSKTRHKSKRSGATQSDGYKRVALSLLALVTVAVVVLTLRPMPSPSAAYTPSAPKTAAAAGATPFGPAVTQIQNQIEAALRADSWPELNPSLDDAIAGPQAPADISQCGQMGPIPNGSCTWGNPAAPKTAVIVGDSVAMTYVGALREALKGRPEWKLRTYAAFGCTFTDTQIANADTAVANACPDRKAQAVTAINQTKPDIVFITNTYEPRVGLASKTPLSLVEWSESTRKIVDQFKDSAKKIVFLSPPPSDTDIKACYTKVSKPVDCVSKVTDQWASVADVEKALAASEGGVFIDSRPWFCSLDTATCPAFVGTTPSKMDKVHMTPEYAVKIGAAVAEELVRLKLI